MQGVQSFFCCTNIEGTNFLSPREVSHSMCRKKRGKGEERGPKKKKERGVAWRGKLTSFLRGVKRWKNQALHRFLHQQKRGSAGGKAARGGKDEKEFSAEKE